MTRRRGRNGNVDGKQSLTQNQHQRSQRLTQANETGLTGKVYHDLEYGSFVVFALTESMDCSGVDLWNVGLEMDALISNYASTETAVKEEVEAYRRSLGVG